MMLSNTSRSAVPLSNASSKAVSKKALAGENSSESDGVDYSVDLVSKLDELFLQWVSREETKNILGQQLDQVLSGNTASSHGIAASGSPRSSPQLQRLVQDNSTVQRNQSSQSSSTTNSSPNEIIEKLQHSDIVPPLRLMSDQLFDTSIVEDQLSQFDNHFQNESAIEKEPFVLSFKEITGLPMFLGSMVYNQMLACFSSADDNAVTKPQLDEFWRTRMCFERETCAFNIIKQQERNQQHLSFFNFKALVLEIIEYHPGLEILRESAEFRDRYAETVTVRIFHGICKSKRTRMTLQQFKSSRFLQILCELEGNPEINANVEFFSYEHFYVIYCKFWQLDTDHNLWITQEELEAYNVRSLSQRAVQRVFRQPAFDFQKTKPDLMSYVDFVYFILCEEDKTTEASIEFWFRCLDTDVDGVLSVYEMELFYNDQLQRLRPNFQDIVTFKDFLCQCVDMIHPAKSNCFTLKDLKKNRRISGNIFSCLTNILKFVILEREDLGAGGTREISDWHVFASLEYQKRVEDDRNSK
jgi:serine/threonine-protein phosphatase 2A regulatory subunit B''